MADAKPVEQIDKEAEKHHLEGFYFSPITTEKRTLIQRTTNYASKGDTVVARLDISYGVSKDPSVDPKELEELIKNVEKLQADREKDRKDLQECNTKLENYIEKSKFYQDQNKKLVDELRALRANWGKETARVRNLYDKDLADLRKRLEDQENEKGILEVKIELLEGDLIHRRSQLEEEIKRKNAAKDAADKQQLRLIDFEAEIELLKRKKDFLDKEKEKLANENNTLRDDVKNQKKKLEDESINHVKAENNAHCLQEELDFLRLVWDLEKKELEKLLSREEGPDSKEAWRSEIQQLFRDLNDTFESQLLDYRSQIKDQFDVKVTQLEKAKDKYKNRVDTVRDDVNKLRNDNDELKDKLNKIEPLCNKLEAEVADLTRQLDELRTDYDKQMTTLTNQLNVAKLEIERLLAEMRRLFDQKIALELEITKYQKMLDLEDSRRKGGKDGEIDPEEAEGGGKTKPVQGGKKTATGKDTPDAKKPEAAAAPKKPRGEMSAKTKSEKNAKGNVEINDVTPDARCLTLKNIGKKDETISGWKIVRNLDNGRQIVEFTIPDITLGADQAVKIYAKNFRPKESTTDLEFEKPSWGLGAFIRTVLVSPDGDEKAEYITRTVYESGK